VRPDAPRGAVAGLADAILDDGVAIVPGWLDAGLVARLRARALQLDAEGEFAPATVGRGEARARRDDVRGDRIRWIDVASDDPAERELAAALERLRREVNRSLALGAFDLEMHYAIYPAGAGYARHRDRFRDDDARVLSCVAYLNDGWRDDDGGALRLHLAAGARDVPPRGGTLVTFLADAVEHEVLPAQRARLSVTGWFRRRTPGR
jgi:SM-20-related protein